MAELDDRAQIFVGETAEAFALMEYSVIRDPGRVDFARQVVGEAMLRVLDNYTARERKGRTNGKHQ